MKNKCSVNKYLLMEASRVDLLSEVQVGFWSIKLSGFLPVMKRGQCLITLTLIETDFKLNLLEHCRKEIRAHDNSIYIAEITASYSPFFSRI